MAQYEIMVIVDRDAEDSLEGVVERITKIITEGGGEVVGLDRWGKRRLAYEIDHKNEGFYLLVTFTAEAEPLAELERVLLLADEIVRFKVARKAA